MIFLSRLSHVLALGAVGCLGFGGKELYHAVRSSPDPVTTDLVRLEAGGEPPDPHVALGPSYAHYAWSMLSARTMTGETESPSTRLEAVFVPLTSSDHPYFKALRDLGRSFDDPSQIPPARMPRLESFRILLEVDDFRQLGDVPGDTVYLESVAGLETGTAAGLDLESREFLSDMFPRLDLREVLVIEKDRRPRTVATCIQFLMVGIVLGLVSLRLFRREAKREKETRRKNDLHPRAGDDTPWRSQRWDDLATGSTRSLPDMLEQLADAGVEPAGGVTPDDLGPLSLGQPADQAAFAQLARSLGHDTLQPPHVPLCAALWSWQAHPVPRRRTLARILVRLERMMDGAVGLDEIGDQTRWGAEAMSVSFRRGRKETGSWELPFEPGHTELEVMRRYDRWLEEQGSARRLLVEADRDDQAALIVALTPEQAGAFVALTGIVLEPIHGIPPRIA